MGKESPSLKKLVLHSKEDKRWSCEKLFISIFICLKLVRPAFLNQAPPYMYALNEESMTHSCKLRSLKMKVHPSDSFFSWYCLGLISFWRKDIRLLDFFQIVQYILCRIESCYKESIVRGVSKGGAGPTFWHNRRRRRRWHHTALLLVLLLAPPL